MNRIRHTGLLIAALFLIFISPNQNDAYAGVTVQKISEAALDELIHSGPNRLLITFIAAWCGPCIDELPALNRLHQKYESRGLKLIGVSIDLEGPRAMQPIVDSLKVEFPVYWYGESAIQKFSIFAIPMVLWVKDGRIVQKLPGSRSEKELDKRIRKFLAQ